MPSYHKKYRSVAHWFGALDPHWGMNMVYAFEKWCLWLEARGEVSDPDEMVRLQGEATGKDKYRLLDLLEEYIRGLDHRVSTQETYYNYVRSFFLHNRVDLPRDLGFRPRNRDKPKIVGTLTVDDLKMVLARCNELYRAVFLSMFMGGMGQGELIYWSDKGLKFTLEQLDAGRVPLRIDLPGRKKGRGTRPFYTFIGSDAVKALSQYFEFRGRSNGAIFLNQYGGRLTDFALSCYWRRQLESLGLRKKGEKFGKNPHEIRDLFRSRWEKSGASGTGAEFILGHIIDPNDYNKAFRDVDFAMSQYIQAEPWLNVLSEEPDKVPRVEVDRRISELTKMQEERLEAISRRLEILEAEKRRL